VPYYFGADDQPEKIALGTFRRNVPDISQGKREERGFSMHITGRLGEPSLPIDFPGALAPGCK
jgi:hypothetical protein